jgi:hypothetical protein
LKFPVSWRWDKFDSFSCINLSWNLYPLAQSYAIRSDFMRAKNARIFFILNFFFLFSQVDGGQKNLNQIKRQLEQNRLARRVVEISFLLALGQI